VPAKLDANAGPAAAASSAKDNETERSFMRFPNVGGLAPRWAQTNRFQAARGLPTPWFASTASVPGSASDHTRPQIADYDALFEPIRARRREVSGRQLGDPERAARVIVSLLERDDPPPQLLRCHSGRARPCLRR